MITHCLSVVLHEDYEKIYKVKNNFIYNSEEYFNMLKNEIISNSKDCCTLEYTPDKKSIHIINKPLEEQDKNCTFRCLMNTKDDYTIIVLKQYTQIYYWENIEE